MESGSPQQIYRKPGVVAQGFIPSTGEAEVIKELKAILSYIVSSNLAWTPRDPCLQITKQANKWMEKGITVPIHNEVLLSCKEE